MTATPKAPKVDYGLRTFHEVLRLEALHFGLWNPGEEPTLDNLRTAQTRYTEHLLELFPPDVKRVLDAGCGTGATAVFLKQRALAVECLTPDAYQIEVFRKMRGDGIALHHSKLQDFTSKEPFDLVLMSESAQYVPTQQLFAAARRNLIPGGWLLISDYFRKQPGAYYKTCHVLPDFLKAAEAAGFTLEHQEDITDRVLPTLVLGQLIYRRYVLPVLEIVSGLLQDRAPMLAKTVELFFRKKVKKVKWYLYEKTEEKLDTQRFKAEVVYGMYRFRMSDPPRA